MSNVRKSREVYIATKKLDNLHEKYLGALDLTAPNLRKRNLQNIRAEIEQAEKEFDSAIRSLIRDEMRHNF